MNHGEAKSTKGGVKICEDDIEMHSAALDLHVMLTHCTQYLDMCLRTHDSRQLASSVGSGLVICII